MDDEQKDRTMDDEWMMIDRKKMMDGWMMAGTIERTMDGWMSRIIERTMEDATEQWTDWWWIDRKIDEW